MRRTWTIAGVGDVLLRHDQRVVSTGASAQTLAVPPKASGPGSGVNGGDDAVEVEASAAFAGVGLAATDTVSAAFATSAWRC